MEKDLTDPKFGGGLHLDLLFELPSSQEEETMTSTEASSGASQVHTDPEMKESDVEITFNTDDNNIPNLIEFLKEHANYMLMNIHDEAEKDVTSQLFAFLSPLMKSLLSLQKLHEFLFVKIALRPLQIDWDKMSMITPLREKSLENVVEILDKQWPNFLHYRVQGQIQLESFLIHFLTLDYFKEGGNLAESEFSDLVKDIKPMASPELILVLDRFACSPPFYWAKILHCTVELSKGNMSVIKEKVVEIEGLRKVLSSRDNNHFERDRGQTDLRCNVTGAYSDILKDLGLDDYYPSKISLVDAIKIRKTNKHPAWTFIHKLLMINFRSREEFALAVNGEDNEDDFCLLDYIQVNQGEDYSGAPVSKLSTLDMLVVIFGCCDNFLKQILARNLYVCKLAIPFLYPLGSPDNVMMSLFALRTIDVELCDIDGVMHSTGVTDDPLPVVSFIRLGRPQFSKSKLLNNLINDNSHNTFFNHDCTNGTAPRRVADGLVECSWFRSDGKNDLPATAMFLNLRGDASLHTKQLNILINISSLVFIIGDAKDLAKESHSKSCKWIFNEAKKSTLLFTSSSDNEKELKCDLRKCYDSLGNDLMAKIKNITSFSIKKSRQKNSSELNNEVGKHIFELVSRCKRTVLRDCVADMEKNGIIIDEHDAACIRGKTLAKVVISHMAGKDKRSLLPLQGDEWLRYSTLLKEFNRVGRNWDGSTVAYRIEKIKQEMEFMREKQLKACDKNITPFIEEFILAVKEFVFNEDVTMNFLNWIKLLLDDKSRKVIPKLNKDYHEKWRKLQMAENAQLLEKLRMEVDQAEHLLVNASLGVENLFRELGQIYEAAKESRLLIQEDAKNELNILPEIAAKLLMNGIPLELIDGDASNVPTTWISAVLAKLSNITKDKRIFVLSVLGIQSSGKSTLLNTMFGLQFSVSAGRCTRGAYLQLVPVDQSAELPFDYVLIIDTEGLRAPELGQMKLNHDNELATLVIGLGDVTVINIKGENTAEMKDVLQISVQAFMRMKAVGDQVKSKRSCVFVHQNVSAIDAEDKMMHACRKLQETLDEMTREAAYSENISDIVSFNQVINYDVDKNVCFFPDLWIGDPPMAPANPGYSQKVYNLKWNLLENIAKAQKTFLTVSDFSIRLNDLWKAILTEDFVFSFRNSLEIKAYNDLEKTYYSFIMELEKEGSSCTSKAKKVLERCNTIGTLEDRSTEQENQISTGVHLKYEEIILSLEKYFEENNLQDITIQWKQQKINALRCAVDDQIMENKMNLQTFKKSCLIDLEQKENKEKNEAFIEKRAEEFAHSLKGKELSRVALDQKFEAMWKEMTKELIITTTNVKVPFVAMMEEVLFASFSSHGQLIRAELKRSPLDVPLQVKILHIPSTFVQTEHISLKELWFGQRAYDAFMGKVYHCKCRSKEAMACITNLTNEVVEEVSLYITDLSKSVVMIQKSHATHVICILKKKIDSNETTQHLKEFGFTILPSFIVKLAVYIGHYCVTMFHQMQDAYNEYHGPKTKLDNYKKKIYSLFFNKVNESSEEITAADLLLIQLEELICREVDREIPGTIVTEVVCEFSSSKHRLMLAIMDDLAHKGNFDSYASYIRDSYTYAFNWITEHIDETVFEKDEDATSRYGVLTENHIRRIFRNIAQGVEMATKEVLELEEPTMKKWIESFCCNVGEIGIRESYLQIASVRKVTRFDKLHRIIFDKLDTFENEISSIFKEATSESVVWEGLRTPYCRVISKLWGCPKQCPFCKEPCYLTAKDHYSQSGISHYCIQHKPGGIAGIRLKDSRCLFTNSCNYSIQSRTEIHYGELRNEYQNHWKNEWKYAKFKDYYKNYKIYFPEWDISPDPTNYVSKYWMWFMATYQHQLKDHYAAELPYIPPSWMNITKEEALEDLHKT